MPFMQQGDLEIAYDIIGPEDGQPWVITPGGRFSKDYGGVREMAQALADRGRKVLVYDRLNCGESAVSFHGPSESEIQADSMAELLRQLGFGPTVIVGGSGGARISLLAAARHPDVAAGLAVWWISGGVYGLMNLGIVYNAPSIMAAWGGRMEDVAALDTWQEVVTRNPRNHQRFLDQDPAVFRETMERWMHAYCACGDPVVPGLTDEQARSMTIPIMVFRSGASDPHHPRETSETVAARLPGARLVEPPWGDREWLDRTEAAQRGGALFDRWHLLVPQRVEWADETIK